MSVKECKLFVTCFQQCFLRRTLRCFILLQCKYNDDVAEVSAAIELLLRRMPKLCSASRPKRLDTCTVGNYMLLFLLARNEAQLLWVQ